jgi:hypothetical protein
VMRSVLRYARVAKELSVVRSVETKTHSKAFVTQNESRVWQSDENAAASGRKKQLRATLNVN